MKVHSSIGSGLLAVLAAAALTACGSGAAPVSSPTTAVISPPAPAQASTPTSPALGTPADAAAPGATEYGGQDNAELSPAESPLVDPVQSDPVQSDPGQTGPEQVDPGQTGSGQTDPASGQDQSSTIFGDWQRHASVLHLDSVSANSTFTTGSSCCDVETWTADWTSIGEDAEDGVVVTLVNRTFIAGEGLGGTLYEGKRFEASPSIGYENTRVLMTYNLGDAPGVNTWCRAGHGVPECGA